jgi:hypothetical protein
VTPLSKAVTPTRAGGLDKVIFDDCVI